MRRRPRTPASGLLLGLLAGLLVGLLLVAGCGSGDDEPAPPSASAAPSTSPSASSTSTTTPPPPESDVEPDVEPHLEPDPQVSWWRGRDGVVVDGVRAAIPPGYADGHLRTAYAFLGYDESGPISWLAMVAPVQVSAAPPGDTSGLRPAPRDLLAFVERADGLTVERLGTIRVAGRPVPVVRIDGSLTLCPREAGSATCRWNTPERFYVFVPYRGGTLAVEGEAPQSAPDDALLTELQEWGDTIRLP